jgi:hypothetical protein
MVDEQFYIVQIYIHQHEFSQTYDQFQTFSIPPFNVPTLYL